MANYYGVFDQGSLDLFAVTYDCPSGTLCNHQVGNQFYCPAGVDGCRVQAYFNCTTASGIAPIVIARTDDTDYSSGWIAYDNGNGGLTSWVYETYVSRSTLPAATIDLPFGDKALLYNDAPNGVKLFVKEQGETDKYWRYKQGSGADLSINQVANCNGRELCNDYRFTYDCSAAFTAYDSDGGWKCDYLGNNFFYTSNTLPGSKTSKICDVPPLGSAVISGNSFDESGFFYNTFTNRQECEKDFCDTNGNVIPCVNTIPDYDNLTSCEIGCELDPLTNLARCKKPFSSVLIEVRAEDNSQPGTFSPEKLTKIRVKTTSQSSISGTMDILIVEDNVLDGVINSNSVYNVPIQTNTFQEVIIPEGFIKEKSYYVKVNYHINNNLYTWGDESNEGYTKFIVANDFQGTLTVTQGINSVGGFTNHPINVQFSFTQGGVPFLPSVENVVVSYEHNGQEVILENLNIAGNFYKYQVVDTHNAGDYNFEGIATYGSRTITKLSSFKLTDEVIQIQNVKLAFGGVKSGINYPNIMTFETTDALGNYIDTKNIVTVKKAGNPVGQIPVTRLDLGKYSVDYTFGEMGLGYSFLIDSNQDGIVSGQRESEELFVSDKEEDPKCTSDPSICGFMQECGDDGLCRTRVDLVLIVIASIFGIVILIVLINKFRKGRSTSNFNL